MTAKKKNRPFFGWGFFVLIRLLLEEGVWCWGLQNKGTVLIGSVTTCITLYQVQETTYQDTKCGRNCARKFVAVVSQLRIKTLLRHAFRASEIRRSKKVAFSPPKKIYFLRKPAVNHLGVFFSELEPEPDEVDW